MPITGEKRLICVAFPKSAVDNISPAIVTALHDNHTPCGQRWTVVEQNGSYTLQNQYGGAYLTVSSDKTHLTTTLGDPQLWDIEEEVKDKGYYKLQIPKDGHVASLPSGTDKTKVVVKDYQGTKEQWILEDYPSLESGTADPAAPGCPSSHQV